MPTLENHRALQAAPDSCLTGRVSSMSAVGKLWVHPSITLTILPVTRPRPSLDVGLLNPVLRLSKATKRHERFTAEHTEVFIRGT